jgi:hypothetical protein
VPVFLPLAALREGDVALSDFITAQLRELGLTLELAARLAGRSKLLLLLDGFDELADEQLRARVLGWIEALVGGGASEAGDIGATLGADSLGCRAALRAQEYRPGRRDLSLFPALDAVAKNRFVRHSSLYAKRMARYLGPTLPA